VLSENRQAKSIDAIADAMMRLDSHKTKETALQKIQEIKESSNKRIYTKYLQNVFRTMNLNIEETDIIKEFEKFC